MRKNQQGSIALMAGGIIAAVVVLAILIIVGIKYERVPPGYVGVSVQKCDGGVGAAPIPVGIYWRDMFCEDVVLYPTNLQSLELMRPKAKDSEEIDDSVIVTSKEGMPVAADVSLTFTLDGAKVPQLYKKFRQELPVLNQVLVRKGVRGAMQQVFTRYTAEELYSDKKEVARAESQAILMKDLSGWGFEVVQFTLDETRPPKQIIDAINAKVAMIQDAQRSEQEVRKKTAEANQKIAAAKGEAESTIERARGEAESTRLRSVAEAAANRLVNESVTPSLIQYRQAQRWDGKLSLYSGSATPLIQMGK